MDNKTALIVDDSRTAAQVLLLMLQRESFHVDIVDHGDAVTAAANAPAPAIFGGPDAGFPAAMFPTTQALIDVIMLIVLTRGRVRTYYVGRLNMPMFKPVSDSSFRPTGGSR